MPDADEEQDGLIRLLAPTVHVRTAPDEDLLRAIMATPVGRPARLPGRHRRGLIAAAAVAGLAAAAFAVFAALPASAPVGAPPAANALSITEDAGYLVITIKDPAADPARYQAELRRRGLNITIELAPAQPEDVGKVVFAEVGDGGRLTYIEDPGRCTANGSCAVGVRVPAGFSSYARITFGRTPLPGEETEAGSQSGGDAKTDALLGKTVAEVRRIVAAQGRTLDYRVGWQSLAAPADQVPGSWKVYQAAYGTGHSIIVWASEDGTAPRPPAGK
ncbi:hypothetical protein [Dactylosporangium salmoneum]|uniref:PASTA domain-containing protein n=1 Tax=Dactylosporangium salmoneum TaxID=53361 RepID=A0ABP5S874_9ACTN